MVTVIFAVEEWVNPHQPVMRGGDGDYLAELRQHRAVVSVGKAVKESGNVVQIDGHQTADLDVPLAQFARNDA